MLGETTSPPDLGSSSARPPLDGQQRARAEPVWLWLKYALLTRDRRQQIRLAQSGLANLLMLGCVAMILLLNAYGITDQRYIWPWTLISVGGMVAVFALIRSGRVMHWQDPSLTFQQMFFATLCAGTGYCISGSARAVLIPILAIVLMFGMFGMTQRQVLIVGVYTLAVFGAASLYWMLGPEAGEPVGPEIARLMMVAIVVAGVVVLTGRLHGMRERSRQQRAALSSALERIRELAFFGVHMTDKQRHRRTRAPNGYLPNWLLFVFFACAVGVAALARNIV